MDSSNKILRKVQFTLPNDQETSTIICSASHRSVQLKKPNKSKIAIAVQPPPQPLQMIEHKVHGTSRYINGTLNFGAEDYVTKRVVSNNQVSVPLHPSSRLFYRHDSQNTLRHTAPPSSPLPPTKILRPCLKDPTVQQKPQYHRQRLRETKTNPVDVPTQKLPIINLGRKINNYFSSNNDKKSKVSANSSCGDCSRNSRVEDKRKLSAKPPPPAAAAVVPTQQSHVVILSPLKYLKNQHQKNTVKPPPRKKFKKQLDIVPRPTSASQTDTIEQFPSTSYSNNNNLNDSIIPNFQHLNLNKSENFANTNKSTTFMETLNPSTSSTVIQPSAINDDFSPTHIYNSNNKIMQTLLVRDEENLSNFLNFVERWRTLQRATSKKLNQIHLSKYLKKSSVQKSVFKPSDVKSSKLKLPKYRERMMSVQKMPLVTSLLRASRDADETLLTDVLTSICQNGISPTELNSDDKNGRTAISYICASNLVDILNILLNLPGIDVNKADKDGNTPLHFAAEAGKSDMVNMLLTRSRSIQVDAKNLLGFTPLMKAAIQGQTRCAKLLLFAGKSDMVNMLLTRSRSIQVDAKNLLGFTPLMKAAIQGQTRCAKLLLFAGASPVHTDPRRGFRAEQWARLTTRYGCAEMIEKCARVRLLEKTTSCKWGHDLSPSNEKAKLTRTRTSPPMPVSKQGSDGGIRSALKKMFPFNVPPFREKNIIKSNDNNRCSELVSHFTASTLLYASGPALTSPSARKAIKNIIRPSDIPQIIINPANDKLIHKYEQLLISGAADYDIPKKHSSAHQTSSPIVSPKIPPRTKIRSK